MAEKYENTVNLFTGSTVESMIKRGGSGDWYLAPARATSCVYAVCYWNSNGSNLLEKPHGMPSAEGQIHGNAFFVGKIANVEPSPIPEYKGRYVLRFSHYARLREHGMPSWGGYTNPVRYGSLSDLGLSTDDLQWAEMPEANFQVPVRPLSIEEAKAGLAASLGISASNIRIQIDA